MKKSQAGFTLIELLVVIAIVGILSSVVLSSLNQAREKAKIATAKGQLQQIRSAIIMLQNDTGKSIRGCPTSGTGAGREFSLSDLQSGLTAVPTDFVNNGGCQWTAQDAANWRGPYIKPPVDPWDKEYWFDEDYHPLFNTGGQCVDTYPGDPTYIVLASGGANKLNGAEDTVSYDCDDIFIFVSS